MQKRKEPRTPTSILIDVIEQEYAVTKGRGHVANISTGGIGLDSSIPLAMGTSLFLKIDAFIEVKGEIVWSEMRESMFHYGVRFTGLNFLDKLKLKKHISAHFKK